jgi:hypothetical protein
MLTALGVAALTFMMLMYALERRGPRFVAAFALGCALSSTYGFLSGAWPFGGVEAIWTVLAARRYTSVRDASAPHPAEPIVGAPGEQPRTREPASERSEVAADRLE